VDNKLPDLNAYLFNLQALPAWSPTRLRSRGRSYSAPSAARAAITWIRGVSPTFIVPMKTIFPGDDPMVLSEQRDPPLNPVLIPGRLFDDKMAVVNASQRGLERGIALPLLLDPAQNRCPA